MDDRAFGGGDKQARTDAIMSKFDNMPQEQAPAEQSVVAAEDIKAGEKLRIEGGMAYSAVKKDGGEADMSKPKGEGDGGENADMDEMGK